MNMNPLAVAARGKGFPGLLRRAGTIWGRYGLTTYKMGGILAHFAQILGQFECGATFPITTATLARNRNVINQYHAQDIEFAVHGLYHVDHSRLSLPQQLNYLEQCRRLFTSYGLTSDGFRCPYLRWNSDTIAALSQTGFLYDSSQALAWDVGQGTADNEAYRRALEFYGALQASQYPSLPRWENGLVEIPYCLPDDESLVDRFQYRDSVPMSHLWREILAETYRLGELFTLGLHPERIYPCETALKQVLEQARCLSPGVWITRLDTIARWWKERMEATVTVTSKEGGKFHLYIQGPAGMTVMARGVALFSPSVVWYGPYRLVADAQQVHFYAEQRPFIAVSPASSPYLKSFLHQQGYIVEEAENGQRHVLFLERPQFGHQDERPLLAQIEQGDFPLVQLGRWPHGARSALCITGDIDALTIWDYSLRFLGR
jgi:peptidoglycan/xylan/chitin deacetylase (PgdA/CDA1 family)